MIPLIGSDLWDILLDDEGHDMTRQPTARQILEETRKRQACQHLWLELDGRDGVSRECGLCGAEQR